MSIQLSPVFGTKAERMLSRKLHASVVRVAHKGIETRFVGKPRPETAEGVER